MEQITAKGKIVIKYDEDGLFGNEGAAAFDVSETCLAFEEQIEQAVCKVFPNAVIEFRCAPHLYPSEFIPVDHPFDGDLDFINDVLHSIEAEVYEGGEFWKPDTWETRM